MILNSIVPNVSQSSLWRIRFRIQKRRETTRSMDVVKMRVVMVIACHWDCWSRDGDPLIIQVMVLFSFLFSFLLVNRYFVS